jgi:hypothetical protein
MAKQVSYGIIGCGMMGQEHLRNIALPTRAWPQSLNPTQTWPQRPKPLRPTR